MGQAQIERDSTFLGNLNLSRCLSCRELNATHDERTTYFQMAPPEQAVLAEFGTTLSKIYFILQLGYFKARHRFFVFEFEDVLLDAHYVKQTYFPTYPSPWNTITKVTRLKQQRMILRLTGYRDWDEADRYHLRQQAEQTGAD